MIVDWTAEHFAPSSPAFTHSASGCSNEYSNSWQILYFTMSYVVRGIRCRGRVEVRRRSTFVRAQLRRHGSRGLSKGIPRR